MTTYATIALPAALGDRLRAVQHLAAAPTTLGEYVAAPDRHRSFIDPSGMYCDSSQSCCGTHAEHEIAMGGVTRRTHCVLDTLLLAALEGATASVRSVSPLSGAVVKLEVGADGVTAEPSSAVMSFGLRNEDGESVFDTLCPYLNAFPSHAEYQRWADGTPEATTVAMSVAQAWSFARDLLAPAPENGAPDGSS
ncbi:MAG: alkylmercury lyase family protein [Dehalococcoidia bacterium]|nr:alkylmercury lyase family protein [Dehalococcoidia bacterium]